jgi:hypothetical protein
MIFTAQYLVHGTTAAWLHGTIYDWSMQTKISSKTNKQNPRKIPKTMVKNMNLQHTTPVNTWLLLVLVEPPHVWLLKSIETHPRCLALDLVPIQQAQQIVVPKFFEGGTFGVAQHISDLAKPGARLSQNQDLGDCHNPLRKSLLNF